jgi:hypothetical protein
MQRKIYVFDMTKKIGAPKKEVTLTPTERSRLCRERKRNKVNPPVEIQPLPKPKIIKTRKQRSDSVAAAVSSFESVASKKQHMPPAHMRLPDGAMDYWFGIMETRNLDDWTAPELVIAANLCKLNVLLESEEMELEVEGNIIKDYNGRPVLNPRAVFVEKLHARKLATMRSLRMGGKSAGDARALVGGRVIDGNARDVSNIADESGGLLA